VIPAPAAEPLSDELGCRELIGPFRISHGRIRRVPDLFRREGSIVSASARPAGRSGSLPPVPGAVHHPQLANFRDLVGLPVAGGQRVREGVLYRGDAAHPGDGPPGPTHPWPPAVVIDLRSADEVPTGSVWPASTSVHHVPLLAALAPALHGMAAPNGTADLYRSILQRSAEQVVQIVHLVATAPGATLLHCTMGRDRTGVAIAVVLLACGVDRASIVADYEATRGNLPAVLSRLRAIGMAIPPDDELPPHALGLDPAAIEVVLDELGAAPGGAVGWLMEHGATEDDITRLRGRLVR
jgi:protein-tyrosine phosphatase